MEEKTLTPKYIYHQWEVWLGENNEMRGRIIDEWRIAQLKNLYEYHYEIKGRSHIYYIVSHDSVTRAEAIWFASQLHEGKVRRLHIDLSGIGR
jgi:hypothetical protein